MHSLLLAIVCFSSTILLVFASTNHSTILKRDKRFLSFDSKDGKIDIDLELSVPFISIPLNSEDSEEGPKPLANVNLKSIAVAGLVAAITTFVVPLLFKSHNMEHRYRRDDVLGLQEAGQAISELLFGNNHITPCLQQFVCIATAKAKKLRNPTSSDKIIDGLTNLGWFKSATNGTAIEEAIKVGRLQHAPCTIVFKGCKIPEDVFQALMDELGIY
ncbi:uncharacterized protein [Chelonus insularis]|uniref:uncharacterized protein n=1 Tax=Chelonus insularis TaxID=460826 RepID=UPI001589BD79|nr:uncharacterized protein LOC118066441 [Chelonus insularis]